MAITIQTGNPTGLLSAIKKAIDGKSVVTWAYDTQGNFTHTPDQWKNKAWLRPTTDNGKLSFTIVWPKGVSATKTVSGIYQGRFIEMLVTHFEDEFTSASVTIP